MVNRRIGAIIIRRKKVLLVTGEGRDVYWTPGGKAEGKETPQQTLRRELKEELNIQPVKMNKYLEYTALNKMTNKVNKFSFYLVAYKGRIKASNEIDKVIWCSSKDILSGKVAVSEGAKRNVLVLKKKGLL